MAILGVLRKFEKAAIPAIGGGEVKVKLRKSFLNPLMATNIAAILHIGGKRVYLSEGGSLSIGRAKSSDIRILDPKIDLIHAELVHTADGIRILNHSGKAIALVDKDGKTMTIEPDGVKNFEGTPVPEDARVVFGLMEIRLETFKTTIDIPDSLSAPQARPPITEISPEAIVRADEAPASSDSIVADPPFAELVRGTTFHRATTKSELLTSYFKKMGKAELRSLIAEITVGGGSSIFLGLMILGAIFSSPLTSIIGLFFVAPIAVSGGSFALYYDKYKLPKLKYQLKGILDKLGPSEITRELSLRSTGEKREILRLLRKADRKAVAAALKEAAQRPALPEPKSPAKS